MYLNMFVGEKRQDPLIGVNLDRATLTEDDDLNERADVTYKHPNGTQSDFDISETNKSNSKFYDKSLLPTQV